jgi:hypothetical protein
MLNTSGIVPGHSILHLLDKDGESQPTDIAQQLGLLGVFALFYWVLCFLMSRYALTFQEQIRGQPQMAHRS